jgi:hypothetical protein
MANFKFTTRAFLLPGELLAEQPPSSVGTPASPRWSEGGRALTNISRRSLADTPAAVLLGARCGASHPSPSQPANCCASKGTRRRAPGTGGVTR